MVNETLQKLKTFSDVKPNPLGSKDFKRLGGEDVITPTRGSKGIDMNDARIEAMVKRLVSSGKQNNRKTVDTEKEMKKSVEEMKEKMKMIIF